jgi:hypothetical protein
MGNTHAKFVSLVSGSGGLVRSGSMPSGTATYVGYAGLDVVCERADPRIRAWLYVERRIDHLRRYLHRGTDELRRMQKANNDGERSPPCVLDAMV